MFDGLADWWNGLPFGQQLLLIGLLAMALAVPFGFGAGFFLAGGLTYLAGHGHGAASLLRDPRAASRDYLRHSGLAGMALDAGELALTFVPVGAAGARAGAAVRGAAEEYLADPAAWRAAQRAFLVEQGERGAVDVDAFGRILGVNGRRPINADKWAGKVYDDPKGWTPELRAEYPIGVRYTDERFPDLSPYATHTVKLPGGFGGSREQDFRRANKLMGWKARPDGYTWHHVEDGVTLQLVPTELHDAVRHTGGHAAKPRPSRG